MASRLEEVEARRAKRRAAAKEAADDQKATDLEAIDELEMVHGVLRYVEVEHAPGLPVLAAVRCPKPVEFKRFQDRVRPKNVDGMLGDTAMATAEIGAVCQVYPVDADIRAQLHEARPGLLVQLGGAALDLARGRAEAEGKG